MKRPAQRPAFLLRFTGHGVTPEVVSIPKLADALRAVQRLVVDHPHGDEPGAEASGSEGESETPAPSGGIHLLDVRRGSAVYPIHADNPEQVLGRLRLANSILHDPTRVNELPTGISSIEDLSRIARNIGCVIEFHEGGKVGRPIATITPATYEELSKSLFVTGETTLYGRVERVGGRVENHCGLRIEQQPNRQIVCKVASVEVARELGRLLYEDVVVEGKATWFRHDWTVKSFEIRGVKTFKPKGFDEMVRAIREAGGQAWDEVEDPEAFIRELRQ